MNHEQYMERCFQLAETGRGSVSPNPMVGAVLVINDEIVAEGYHQQFGGPHAEVNALSNVAPTTSLSSAWLYVNLEPCSHIGKTPPCADLIISKGIQHVVVSNTDPNPLVSGKGIEKLRAAGIEVITGILEEKGREINKRFFTFHEQKRPYIILKWAQTPDGYISRFPIPDDIETNWITGKACKKLVHQWRAQEDAIMIGTNTAINDNPQLTTRLVEGKNPIRIVIDKKLMIPEDANIFKEDAKTIVFTALEKAPGSTTEYVKINFEGNRIKLILTELYNRNIASVIVEGGAILLNSFLEQDLWDEARILVGNKNFGHGIKAPAIDLKKYDYSAIEEDQVYFIKREEK